MILNGIRFVVLMVLLFFAVYTDLTDGKIYNKLTIPAIVLGVLLNGLLGALQGEGISGLLSAVLGSGIGFAGFLVLFLLNAMGGGDIKLMAAVGAFVGYPGIFYVLYYSLLAGGILALSKAIWLGTLWKNLRNIYFFFFQLLILRSRPAHMGKESSQRLPFAVAVFAGCLWAAVLGNLP
jgi:prepilin peptidase CpaA